MAIKRDKYDATVSDLVREFHGKVCQRCGRDGSNGEWRIDCAHIFGRRNQSVRYDVDNLMCLCFTCHQLVDQDHEEKRRLAIKILGDTRYEWLCEKRHKIKKWLKGEKDEMRKHYMEQLGAVRKGEIERLVNYE